MLNPEQGRASLGLGTAATHDAQTSLTDTTAGRLMEVGAFGLGGVGTTVTSFDDISRSQIYGGTATVLSGERGVITVVGNLGTGGQIAFRGTTSAEIHVRTFFRGGTPSSFFQLYHTGNLVNPIQGSGEANYIPKFTAGATLGNSSIYESGGAIIAVGDINTYNHRILAASAGGDRYIELNRGGSTYGTTTYRDWMIKANGTTSIQFLGKYSNTETLLAEISSGGNFYSQTASIGKTSVTSGYMLDVNGAIRAEGNIYATGNITGAGEVTAAGNITTEGRLHYKNLNGVVVTQGYSSSVTLSCNNGLHYYINHSAGNMTINISNIYPGSSGNIILYNSNSTTTRNVTLGTMSTYDGIVLNKYTSGTFTGLIGYHVITWFAISQGATANRAIMLNINKYS